MSGNPRLWVGIVGFVGLVIVLLMGTGFISGSVVPNTNGNPCQLGGCPIGLVVSSPHLSASSLNVTVTVSGTFLTAGTLTAKSGTVLIAGVSYALGTPVSTSSTFLFPPFTHSVSSPGTYGITATVVATGPTPTPTYTGTSSLASITVQGVGSGPPPTTCDPNCPTAHPSFHLDGQGLVAYLNDTSTFTNGATASLLIAWGDGQTSAGQVGQHFVHTYVSATVATVKDTLTVVSGSYNASATAQVTTAFAAGTTQPSQTPGSTSSVPSSSVGFTPVLAALAGFFAGLILIAFLGITVGVIATIVLPIALYVLAVLGVV